MAQELLTFWDEAQQGAAGGGRTRLAQCLNLRPVYLLSLGPARSHVAADELLGFVEKPSGAQLEEMAHASRNATSEKPFEASMGIYVFNKDVLVELLADAGEVRLVACGPCIITSNLDGCCRCSTFLSCDPL